MADTTIMTEEEKKELKRAKQREYMKMRRATDPEFNAKQKELNRNRKKHLYDNNPEFRAKQQEYCREKARDKANYKKLYEELLESVQPQ